MDIVERLFQMWKDTRSEDSTATQTLTESAIKIQELRQQNDRLRRALKDMDWWFGRWPESVPSAVYADNVDHTIKAAKAALADTETP